MQRQRDDFQTDALRPAALPTASLKPLRTATGTSVEEQSHTIDQSSEAYLDAVYEDWNKKVDVEVETLVDGMAELVNIANIGNKDKHRIAQEAFEAQCRTESMVSEGWMDSKQSILLCPRSSIIRVIDPSLHSQVRAATSLLSITHSLKLLFLLSDEQQIATKRDQVAELFKHKTESERAFATQILDSLLTKGGASRPS